jgi:peptide/nickel transport system ATP-binding protein
VRSVRKSFGGHRAVDGVSLTLGAGQTLGVVGESASGKSTVARMIMGLTRPDEGEVLLAGQPWSAASERSRRRRRPRIQLVHQDPYAAFDPRYTIGQSIGEALPGLARSVQRARVAEWLGRVGLDERLASRRPHQLSGGQRQRAAIARALAPQPQVLICDEPVSALDASVRAQALDLLARLQRETGVAMLFISHDLGIVEQVSNQLIVMKGGAVVEEGIASDVFEQPRHPYTRELLAAIPRLPADLNQSPPSGGPTARVS